MSHFIHFISDSDSHLECLHLCLLVYSGICWYPSSLSSAEGIFLTGVFSWADFGRSSESGGRPIILGTWLSEPATVVTKSLICNGINAKCFCTDLWQSQTLTMIVCQIMYIYYRQDSCFYSEHKGWNMSTLSMWQLKVLTNEGRGVLSLHSILFHFLSQRLTLTTLLIYII